MNVNELLDTIEDTLEESAGMPLSGGKRIVDVEQIRDYLDEIRQNLPVELRQAQSIVSDRAQLIESANAQAQAIVKKAEERARVLVSEAEIVKAAQQRAGEIVSAAQPEARTVRQTVPDDCDNMLISAFTSPKTWGWRKISFSQRRSHTSFISKSPVSEPIFA